MRLHYLQHVPFEELAKIEIWAKGKGHYVSGTKLFKKEILPPMNFFDCLIILGGPMNIYEESKFPWLVEEKKFIAEAIASEKIILGVCLGAQLIASVLGSPTYRNRDKEIGWFEVILTQGAKESAFFKVLPPKFMAFHWHGDTFGLPPGSTRIARSEGCENQAFEYDGRVLGLQFHLESSAQSIANLIKNCGDELSEGKFVQAEKELVGQDSYLAEMERLLFNLLDKVESKCSET